MAPEPFASSPFVVGKSAPAAAEPHRPAEESLCPVVSHELGQCRVQASGGRRLAQGAGGQARPVLQPAVPLARRRRAVAAPAAERLSDRPRQGPPRVPLQVRGPRHLRAGDARCAATSSTWSGRWGSASPSIRPGSTSSCSAAASVSPPWRRSRSSRGERGVGVTAILSARSAEFVMADDLFAAVGRSRRPCSIPTAAARSTTSSASSRS